MNVSSCPERGGPGVPTIARPCRSADSTTGGGRTGYDSNVTRSIETNRTAGRSGRTNSQQPKLVRKRRRATSSTDGLETAPPTTTAFKNKNKNENDARSLPVKKKYKNPDHDSDPCLDERTPYVLYLTMRECRMAQSLLLAVFVVSVSVVICCPNLFCLLIHFFLFQYSCLQSYI